VGLEGAGVVVAAGANQVSLLGKTVAALALSGGLFAQYKTLRADECVVLPDGVAAEEGASTFVNPLTALAIVETVRLEAHRALIHTAAASNLGQMLVKICLEDDVPLVNVVRKPEQVKLLRDLGAKYVCNSGAPSFRDDLIAAILDTEAQAAFDATGGGALAGELLAAMEAAADARATVYNPYGTSGRKLVYVYGRLDHSPVVLAHEHYGLAWGVSGWSMPSILERAGPARAAALRKRVLTQLRTTFASRYTRKITLHEVLERDVMLAYCRQATGEKFLITPNA
jgi:NADPH:quinone reductase-like Zn-dependent oxidoreductase